MADARRSLSGRTSMALLSFAASVPERRGVSLRSPPLRSGTDAARLQSHLLWPGIAPQPDVIAAPPNRWT